MLRSALFCLIVAVPAGIIGFGGLAGAATDIVRVLCLIFIALFVVALASYAVRGSEQATRL